jgi:hypothetical protein
MPLIRLVEKHILTPISALRDSVRNVSKYSSSEARQRQRQRQSVALWKLKESVPFYPQRRSQTAIDPSLFLN